MCLLSGTHIHLHSQELCISSWVTSNYLSSLLQGGLLGPLQTAVISLEHLLSYVQIIAPLLVCTMSPRCRCLSCSSGHRQDQTHVGYLILLLKNELRDYSRGACFRENHDTATYFCIELRDVLDSQWIRIIN